MTAKIVLFGATGYTGHLVAEAFVKGGLRPVLCGRNKEKLDRLAAELGGLQIAVADIRDETALAAQLSRGDILISTVGPFAKYGRTAVLAAVRKGALYIDSTGEPAFIEAVFENFGPQSLANGATLMPACGYDYVPGNCAAGLLLEAAGAKGARVDIGYYSKFNGRIGSLQTSQGTQSSLRLAMVVPIKVWRSGKLVQETGGIRVRRFEVDGMDHPGLTISGTEHFSLPRIYPDLEDINTYLGWFAKRTYFMQRAAQMQSWLLKIPGYRAVATLVLSVLPESKGRGPNAEQREMNTSHIIGEAFGAGGEMLSRVELVGVDGYTFTARFIAWAAEMAVSGKISKTGAIGPVEAFGLDALRGGCEQSGLTVAIPK